MGLQAWDSTAKAESPLDQFYFSEQESEEHTIEKERKAGGQRRPLERRVCMQLLGSDDALVLPVFRDMVSVQGQLCAAPRMRPHSPLPADRLNAATNCRRSFAPRTRCSALLGACSGTSHPTKATVSYTHLTLPTKA